jgi:hypothetical protein
LDVMRLPIALALRRLREDPEELKRLPGPRAVVAPRPKRSTPNMKKNARVWLAAPTERQGDRLLKTKRLDAARAGALA